ncbi:MAG: tetratricopeptide repeat protein [Blastocatellia bacterium]
MGAERRFFDIAPIIIALLASLGVSQAPSAIQFFLPGGGLPGREIRFTLTRYDGLIEILFTDTKGKFLLTGNLGRDGDYTITVEGDRRTFETTTQRFRLVRSIAYTPVFLRPLKGEAPPPKEIVDVSVFDAKVPAEAKAAYEQAMKAVNENQAETAISEFTRALSLYPQYLRALNDLGVLYLKLNRLDEAAATFTQAISLNSRFYFPRLNLGVVYNRQGNFGEAIKVLDKLAQEQPSLASARVQLAEALVGLAQTDAAQEQLRLALADKNLDSATRADSHFKLGMLLNREERYAPAIAEFEKAIAINPQAANAYLYLGGAQLQLKKMAEAEASLLKAYELGGNRVAGAQLFLGQLYYLQQKFDLSQRALEQYLKDMPNAPNAGQVKALIERVKSLQKQK